MKNKLALGMGIFLIIGMAFSFFVVDFNKKRIEYNTHVAENVYFNHVDISGKSFSDVSKMVLEQQDLLKKPVVFSINTSNSLNLDIEDIGWSINATETINQLISANHNFKNNTFTKSDWIRDLKTIYLEDSSKVDIKLEWSFDSQKLDKNIQNFVDNNAVAPRNAEIKYGKTPKIIESKDGILPNKELIKEWVLSQIASGSRETTSLPVTIIKPEITTKNLPKVIIVNKKERKFYLYNNDGTLEKTYRCAIGTPSHPTPEGDFKVVRKLHNAPWINPGSAWAKNMPKSIPAGPNNPMGVHKIGINVSGIYFHGVPSNEFSSIGTAASHGCMRMMPNDVKDLYGRVEIGTLVFIR